MSQKARQFLFSFYTVAVMKFRPHMAAALLAVAACGAGERAPPPLIAAPAASSAAAAPATPSDALLPFVSPESMRRLERSQHKVDFFPLADQFETQENAGQCGPTTAVIVMNTLTADGKGPERPVDRSTVPSPFADHLPPGVDPFIHRFTQRAFFGDPRVTAVKSQAAFFGQPATPGDKPDPGLQVRQLHDILVALGFDATLRIMDDKMTDVAARDEILANLARPDDYAIVNYFRPGVGQPGGGHISPVAAYDEASDSFLVLDVNPNNGKSWVWVPAARLFAAMRTHDRVENRGYLLVGKRGG